MKAIFFVAVMCMVLITTTLAECNMKGYNFKKYSDKEYIYDDDGYKYSFSFCSLAQFNSDCARKGGNSCIVNPQGSLINIGSKWDDANGPKEFTETSNGLSLTFDNAGTNVVLSVDITCAKEAKLVASPPGMGKLKYDLQHPVACKGGGGSSGLSGGAIFLIVLFSVFAVYVIGFCFYNIKFRNMSFLQAFPHRSFWFSLPSLFIAGIKFTFSGCRKKEGSYEQQESYGSTDV